MRSDWTRLAGWSLVVNAIVAVVSGIALMGFFATRQAMLGTVSDIGGVFFALTLLPAAWWFFRHKREGRPRLSVIVLIIGAVGMVGLAVIQGLFVLGIIRAFTLSLPATALIGLWLILVSLIAARDHEWPELLVWLGVLGGVGLVASLAGLAVGTVNPLAWAAYLLGAAQIAWAAWLGARVLRGAPRRVPG